MLLPIKKNFKITVGAIVAVVLAVLCFFILRDGNPKHARDINALKKAREVQVYAKLHLDLLDPGQAPNHLRSYARKGYQIIIDTQTHAKEYIRAKLDCTNCHFAGGETTGGAQGSISLAGVAAKYPAYSHVVDKVLDLPARVNNCFEKSMNGSPLPLDGELMLSIITYLQWISKGVAIYSPTPWLGLKHLDYTGPGNIENGKRIYHIYCALCHRDDGQGGETNPPLWGPNSFNDGAGLHRPADLATFIFWNMPYMDSTPVLTEKQAWDVAAYIHAQPRPVYRTTNK